MLLCSVIYLAASFGSPEKFPSILHNTVYLMLGITIVAEWHYILNVVPEMANALEIRILCVKDKIPKSELV